MNKTKRKNSIRNKKNSRKRNNKMNTANSNKKHKSHKRIKRSIGGNDSLRMRSMNPAKVQKQIMLDAKSSASALINKLTAAELNQQEDQRITADNRIKLDMSVALSRPYDPLLFWGTLFMPDELTQIINLLKSDTCDEIQGMIPAFEMNKMSEFPDPIEVTSNGTKVYEIDGVMHYVQNDADEAKLRSKYDNDIHLLEKKKTMCATMLIMGIITAKLQATGDDYKIISKGGVAVSLAVSGLTGNKTVVPINDIDFKIMSMNPSVRSEDLATLANHVGELVAWLLTAGISNGYSISILDPSTKSNQPGYKDIVKLSLKRPDGVFMPILDLDFGVIEDSTKFFDHTVAITGGTVLPISFAYQSVIHMLAEKLYYYSKYLTIKDVLDYKHDKIKTESIFILKQNWAVTRTSTPFGYITYDPTDGTDGKFKHNEEQVVDLATSQYFIDKFKKSIIQLTTAIIQSSETLAEKKETSAFIKTLERLFLAHFMESEGSKDSGLFPKIPSGLVWQIVDSIYPRTVDTLV